MSSGSAMTGAPYESSVAPSGRDSAVDFAKKRELLAAYPLLTATLDAVPGMVMILNAHRQIVAANQAILRIHNLRVADVLEKRPGDVLGCLWADEGPDGCGTGKRCAACLAVRTVLESQAEDTQVVKECRVITGSDANGGALDLRVTATPLQVEGERFTVIAVEDISQRTRLAVLQRVFFHDVLNTASCITGYAYFLSKEQQVSPEVSDALVRLSDQLVEEINAQRDLLLAESGDLVLQLEWLSPKAILEDLRDQYRRTSLATHRCIQLGDICACPVKSDPRLLMRVLGNMLKNGLEAIPVGQTVTLGCRDSANGVTFWVHDPGEMPELVQLQMFQRSFSTKAASGRGLGTYSMKLLGERYLAGKVAFSSQKPEGTIFSLTLPRTGPLEVRQTQACDTTAREP